MPRIVVSQRRPKANVNLGRDTIVLRRVNPTIYAYDSKYIEPPATFIDGGTPIAENTIVDAGFYNTTSWEVVWDGGVS